MFGNKHKNADKIKVDFTVTVLSVKDVPKSSIGNLLVVEAKRGNKDKNARSTTATEATSGELKLNEKLQWTISVFPNAKDKKIFEPKKSLHLCVKEMKGKDKKSKGTSLGKGEINLSEYAAAGTVRTQMVQLETKKGKAPSIALKIEATWVKVGNQNVVKKTDAKVTDSPKSGPTSASSLTPNKKEVKINGEDYDLVTANEMTENTSISDNEEPDFSEDSADPMKDDSDEVPVSKSDSRSRVRSSSTAPAASTPRSNGTSSSTSAASNIQIETLKSEIGDLQRDKTRLERQVKTLKEKEREKDKEIDSLRDELEELKNSAPSHAVVASSPLVSSRQGNALSEEQMAELEDLRRDKKRLEMKFERSQNELKELKAQKEREEVPVEDPKKKSLLAKMKEKEKGGSGDAEAKVELARVKKELQKAQDKMQSLESASTITDGIFFSILNTIKTNTKGSKNQEIPNLISWFGYAAKTFKLMKDGLPASITFDKSGLKHEDLPDPLDIEEMESVNKFFYSLASLGYDIYSTIVQCYLSRLQDPLVKFVFDPTSKGKLDVQLGEFIQDIKSSGLNSQLSERLIADVFFQLDSIIFNGFLKKTDCFTSKFGFNMKMSISQIESAMSKVDKHLSMVAGDHMHHTKETANLLVLDKSLLEDETTTKEIYSHLNIIQIEHIVRSFRTDEFSSEPVSRSLKADLDERASRHSGLPLELPVSDRKRVNIFA
eukprot:TRINITY_DN9371_c0_g2_i1.p1 TRINITY_DN9371_c0_g2~~TRINITY_DN9371_c0_g2_i1.p1  ORF type:complete len:718 (+),score=237.13 TRINITY_DN9371_c0_g2_i1:373-2526(+)